MESINSSRMIREYFLDFKRNFKKIPWQSFPVIYMYCLCLGSFELSVPAYIFCAIPVVFCGVSAATHLQLYPNMFYLLPMTGKQREQYGKRAMAIRVVMPGSLVLLWAVFLAGLCGVSTCSAAAIFVGCTLGCFLMHGAAVTEKREESSTMFGVGQAAMMVLTMTATEITETWVCIVFGCIFLPAILLAGILWKRFSLECGRRRNFEGFKREKVSA